MSTPFHSINTCGLASQVANLCVVGMLIFLINNHTAFLPGLMEPNKTFSGVVGYRDALRITPYKETVHWEADLHGDAKKLDTHFVDQKEPRAPNGSVCSGLAEVNSETGAKNTVGIINDSIILQAKTNPNEGNATAQAPKQVNLRAYTALNRDDGGTRDVTASTDLKSNKRARSQHSIVSEKAGSFKNSTPNCEILENHLYRVVQSELNKYKTSEGKYNGIIRILDSKMLQTCYSLITNNPGNLTAVTQNITLDGLNLEWFNITATDIKEGRFKFSPAKQILIPKQNKPLESSPLFIASPREKIVHKALQVLLNAIFEPHFSKSSFGFRPGRSLVNALNILHKRGGAMSWAINGDITKCFDRIPHDLIISFVKERITCVRTLTLIERGLKAGFKDDRSKIIKTKMGIPQGSILSPLLSNIVLAKLDKYIESLDGDLNVGTKRKANPPYVRLVNIRKDYKRRRPGLATEYLKQLKIKSKLDLLDMHNENYRRALYVRYAYDFIVLLASTRKYANTLKAKIADFLKETCGLVLNDQKTTITNTRKGLMFLGALIKRRDNSSRLNYFLGKAENTNTRRSTLRLAVDAPIEKLIEKLIQNNFARRNHKATVLAKGRTDMVHLTHYEIIRIFNSKITGLLNAFRFAGNLALMSRVIWVLRQSCALTLARKLKLKTMKKTFKKFGFDLTDPETGVLLNIPDTFAATYDYKSKPHAIFGNPEEIVDNILKTSRAGKLNKGLPSKCILCGKSAGIECSICSSTT
jgi:group II intron reverse transcriptase/maturase